jgi:hypothetical protein
VHRGFATPCSAHHRSYDRWVPCVSPSRFRPTVIQISAIQPPPRRDWRRPPCARSPPPRSLRPQAAARTPLLHSRPAPPSSPGSPHGRRSSLSGTGVAPPSLHPTAASHLTLLVKHSRSPPPACHPLHGHRGPQAPTPSHSPTLAPHHRIPPWPQQTQTVPSSPTPLAPVPGCRSSNDVVLGHGQLVQVVSVCSSLRTRLPSSVRSTPDPSTPPAFPWVGRLPCASDLGPRQPCTPDLNPRPRPPSPWKGIPCITSRPWSGEDAISEARGGRLPSMPATCTGRSPCSPIWKRRHLRPTSAPTFKPMTASAPSVASMIWKHPPACVASQISSPLSLWSVGARASRDAHPRGSHSHPSPLALNPHPHAVEPSVTKAGEGPGAREAEVVPARILFLTSASLS